MQDKKTAIISLELLEAYERVFNAFDNRFPDGKIAPWVDEAFDSSWGEMADSALNEVRRIKKDCDC